MNARNMFGYERELCMTKGLCLSSSFLDEFEKILAVHGMTKNSDACKRCRMTKQRFGYIRNGSHKPSKLALLQVAVGLKLSIVETELLLNKLGFAFSDCDLADVLIKSHIEEGNADFFSLNEELDKNGCQVFKLD